jgi:hypothetical protein
MRLLSLSLEEIQKLSETMELETKALKDQLYTICWFMRGSLSISEAFDLGQEDLEILSKIVKSNLETTKKSGLPFF